MVGRTVQLRFEYTEDNAGTCTSSGYSAPCGVAIDNVKLSVVPLVDGSCTGLKIITIASSGSNIVVTFNAIVGRMYRLERKIDIGNAGEAWQTVVDSIATIATAQMTDPGGLTLGKAFYRVRLLP